MHKTLPCLTLLAAALALGGCSLAPDYLRPGAPVPQTWPANLAGGQALGGWKSYYTEPRLQGLIAAALEHNRDLRIAVARVDEARALAGIAHADRLPTVNAVGQRTAALVPPDVSGVNRQVNSQRYDAGLGITSFELDFWGRVKSLDNAARASYLASEEARRAFRLALIADVANAYLTLLEFDERLALAKATAASREESRRLIAKRREVGLAGDLDVYAADAAWQNARAEVANLTRSRAAAENALDLLVGTRAELPAGKTLAEQQLIAPPAGGLPAEVLLGRPDVLAAEQKLIGANANIGAARAAFLPRITLTASAGTASRALAGLFKAGSGAWAFTPVLSLPLFDGGRNANNEDLAVARKNIAVAEYERTLQQAFREVADLLVAREQLVEQLQAQEAVATAQDERRRITEARHQAGLASYLELLDAQRESFTARQAVASVRRSLLSVAASLYKALGGGKEEAA